MRLVVVLLVGAVAGAAAATALRPRMGSSAAAPLPSHDGAERGGPVASGRVAVDVSGTPTDPV